MGILSHGVCLTHGPLGGALGARVQQTAHPCWFNTPVLDPDNLRLDRSGTDGDTEYAIWGPDADCVYNGRAVEVFLPQDILPPPMAIDRIMTKLAAMRPMTCTIRVSETRGPERVILPATRST